MGFSLFYLKIHIQLETENSFSTPLRENVDMGTLNLALILLY